MFGNNPPVSAVSALRQTLFIHDFLPSCLSFFNLQSVQMPGLYTFLFNNKDYNFISSTSWPLGSCC